MSLSKAATKVFFPNFVLKLVRSNLPPHQAVFHCPPQLTKPEIKSFLEKVYGIGVRDVRTMNYLGSASKQVHGKKVGGAPNYKKAIVTMTDDFVFPPPPHVKTDEAIRIPPRVNVGRGSANKVRERIEKHAQERGVDLKNTATVKK